MQNINNLTITKSNALVEARYKLNVIQQRVVLACIALVDPRKELPEFVTLTAEQFVNIYGTDIHSAYAHLKQSAKALKEQKVVIKDDSNILHEAIWVSETKYFKKEGKLQLAFSPSIKKYLGEIRRRFSKYEMWRIANLDSTYSIRLFEMLYRFKDTGLKVVRLDEFREQLGMEEGMYPKFADFRKRVLQHAVNEINAKSSVNVTWEPSKTGRSITGLKFTFEISEQRVLPFE